MRKASTLLAAFALGVAFATAVALAAASGVGKKTLGGRGYATDVTVSFRAPPGYRINGSGYENWKGPSWTSPVGTGESNLHFDVHPNFETRSAERAIRDKLGTDAGGIPTKQVAAGPIDVPHVIRGRKVGVVKGFFLIRQATSKDYEGWYDGGVAFGLGTGYPVLAADVDTTEPSSDSSKRIRGMLPSQWNRQAVEQGIRGIAVEGNLAPRTVIARVQARRVVGRVTDTLGHADVGVKVTLRKAGAAPCCNATTTATGAFTLNVPASAGSGTFQLSVAVSGATLTKSIRMG